MENSTILFITLVFKLANQQCQLLSSAAKAITNLTTMCYMLNQIEETILGMACFEVFCVWLRFLLCLFAMDTASMQLVWLKKYWG
jgi:hypothetical protein